MMPAILYRHWLEIRFPVAIAGIAVALLCLFPVAVALLTLLAGVGLPPEHVWVAIHIGSSMFVLLGGFPLLGGSGVRTVLFATATRHPSLYYTLTLPAGRFTWIWTRFVVGATATAALFTALLAATTATLLATGRGVPLGAVAATSVVAGLLTVALQAVFSVLLPLWNERLSVTVYYTGFVIFLMAVPADSWMPTTLAVMVLGGEAAPWSVAWILVLIVAASLCLAAITARRHDF